MKLKILALCLFLFAFHLVEAQQMALTPDGALHVLDPAVSYSFPAGTLFEDVELLDIGLAESLPIVGAPSAHLEATGSGRVVAILDTGTDGTHQDIPTPVAEACFSCGGMGHEPPGACQEGFTFTCPWDFTPQNPPLVRGPGSGAPCEDITGHAPCWHGSHVASTAVGVAPDAGVVAINVSSRLLNPTLSIGVLSSDSAAAMQHVLELSQTLAIDAVNLSFGATPQAAPCDASYPVTAQVVADLYEAGILVVAASGNDGPGVGITFPACLSQVLSVGATDDLDVVATFSSGPPDIYAPGVDIVAADAPGGGYRSSNGTSMAAPHVVGSVALLRELAPWAESAYTTRVLDQHAVDIGADAPRLDIGAVVAAYVGTDTDGDGVGDGADNCTEQANGPDHGGYYQRDIDGDGYGNFCDPDYNQDGVVTVYDYGILREAMHSDDPLIDLNGDEFVNAYDYLVLRNYLHLPPGPSGIAP